MMRRASDLAALAIGIALATLAGCRTDGPVEASSPRARPTSSASVVARGDDARLRVEGRAEASANGPRIAWPATTIHVRFVGTVLDVALTDTPFADEIEDLDSIGVRIDDRPMVKIALDKGDGTYRLGEGLARGRHDVAIVKLTEAEQGTITLRTLTTDGAFERAKPPRTRRLLAIGDSVTAGYGIDGPEGCHYDARYANAARTWVYRAADVVGAERQIVAWSGRGLVYNYDPTLEHTMAELMTRTLPGEDGSTFDAASFVPDAVVVNLGTNDVSRADYDRGDFARAYTALIRRLRGAYPRARIIVAYGPLISDDYPQIGVGTLTRMKATLEGVVTRRRSEGDANVRLLALPGADGREGVGCDNHPSAATHERLAGLLVHALADVW